MATRAKNADRRRTMPMPVPVGRLLLLLLLLLLLILRRMRMLLLLRMRRLLRCCCGASGHADPCAAVEPTLVTAAVRLEAAKRPVNNRGEAALL